MNFSSNPACLKRALVAPVNAAFLIPPVDLGFFALTNGLGGMGGLTDLLSFLIFRPDGPATGSFLMTGVAGVAAAGPVGAAGTSFSMIFFNKFSKGLSTMASLGMPAPAGMRVPVRIRLVRRACSRAKGFVIRTAVASGILGLLKINVFRPPSVRLCSTGHSAKFVPCNNLANVQTLGWGPSSPLPS